MDKLVLEMLDMVLRFRVLAKSTPWHDVTLIPVTNDTQLRKLVEDWEVDKIANMFKDFMSVLLRPDDLKNGKRIKSDVDQHAMHMDRIMDNRHPGLSSGYHRITSICNHTSTSITILAQGQIHFYWAVKEQFNGGHVTRS